MNNSKLTLRQVFSLPEKGTKDSSPERWEKFQKVVSKEVKTINWSAAMPDAAEKICDLFDVKLPDIFWRAWKKADDFTELVAESKQNPEAPKYLELVDHTIRSEHHPYIEVRIADMPAKKIEFVVTVSFKVKGLVLTIKAGEIEEILTGRCEAEGKVEYAHVTIAEKKLAPIPLPTLCRFKAEPIPIVYSSTSAR